METKVNVNSFVEALQDFADWFNGNDFYISAEDIVDSKSIYLKDNDRYIIFRENDIENTVNKKLLDFIKEQKWLENNPEENEEQWEDGRKITSQS